MNYLVAVCGDLSFINDIIDIPGILIYILDIIKSKVQNTHPFMLDIHTYKTIVEIERKATVPL
jgi:hypothetical protein